MGQRLRDYQLSLIPGSLTLASLAATITCNDSRNPKSRRNSLSLALLRVVNFHPLQPLPSCRTTILPSRRQRNILEPCLCLVSYHISPPAIHMPFELQSGLPVFLAFMPSCLPHIAIHLPAPLHTCFDRGHVRVQCWARRPAPFQSRTCSCFPQSSM